MIALQAKRANVSPGQTFQNDVLLVHLKPTYIFFKYTGQHREGGIVVGKLSAQPTTRHKHDVVQMQTNTLHSFERIHGKAVREMNTQQSDQPATPNKISKTIF